jgi:hypothetical protein
VVVPIQDKKQCKPSRIAMGTTKTTETRRKIQFTTIDAMNLCHYPSFHSTTTVAMKRVKYSTADSTIIKKLR